MISLEFVEKASSERHSNFQLLKGRGDVFIYVQVRSQKTIFGQKHHRKKSFVFRKILNGLFDRKILNGRFDQR